MEVHRGWIKPDRVGHGKGARFYPKNHEKLVTNVGLLYLWFGEEVWGEKKDLIAQSLLFPYEKHFPRPKYTHSFI